jgi:hypothetical protein
MCLIVFAIAPDRRTRTILEPVFTAASAVAKQPIPQSRASAVQSHTKCPGRDTQIIRHRLTVFFFNVDTADQVALIRSHCRNQATHAFADVSEFLSACFADFVGLPLSFKGSTQAASAAVLAVVIIQGGAQDRIEPGVQLVCLAKLILAIDDPQAKLLQNILGLGQIAETFDEKPKKHLAVGCKRTDGGEVRRPLLN